MGKPVAEHVVVDAVVGTGELPGAGVVFVVSIVLLLLLLLLLLFVDRFVELMPDSPLHANAATAAFCNEYIFALFRVSQQRTFMRLKLINATTSVTQQ